MHLILASTSPYRRRLLERLELEFTVESPGVDERHEPGEPPVQRAARLAQAKAHAVAVRHPQAVVIGSDQVVLAGETILDKPGDGVRARAQLAHLSGSSAVFLTACCVVRISPSFSASHIDTTRAVFRLLDAAEIARYVERERPFDCAGAFKSEALGVSLLERIETVDPTALVGLPLISLSSVLRRLGFEVP